MSGPRISTTDLGSALVHTQRFSQLTSRSQIIDPDTELSGLVYRYMSDVPDEVISTIADAVMTVLIDQNISDESRIAKIEELLDLTEPLSMKDFESMVSLAQHKLSPPSDDDDDEMKVSDASDFMDDSDDPASELSANKLPKFVALNDPIRFNAHQSLRAEDIDGKWLLQRLDGSDTSFSDLLAIYEDLKSLSHEERQIALEKLLGPTKLSFSRLLNDNFDLIILRTKLSLASSPEEVSQLSEQIDQLVNLKNGANVLSGGSLPQILDLSAVGRPPRNDVIANIDLPDNSTKYSTALYEQFNIPPLATTDIPRWPLYDVADLPNYAKAAFQNIKFLNLIQSKVAPSALESDTNLLVCAPTGAGKTNIALLGITRCLNQGLRVVYISPQKALAQEQVAVFSQRLSGYVVRELTGDSNIGRVDLTGVDIIVSTPEKWDVVSRKATNISLLRTVGLIVFDEIHLLHDEQRGGIIENLAIRHKDLNSRLIGLSATLPNYADVAEFLLVPSSGLFFFDARYRPVPLEQQFVGIHGSSHRKQREAMDTICSEKVRSIAVERGKQVLIFVHSRRDTSKVRRQLLIDKSIGLSETEIGIHHAGLKKEAREFAETNFANGSMRVLVSTATLAWGVNLPAAAVIVRGTQFYNPVGGQWQQLRPQDIIQMLGRAGRPGFDTEGLGIIITNHESLSYVASIATLSLPIESRLMSRILDSVNAEVVLNNVRTLSEGCEWLKQSFWAVRWQKDPFTYGDSFGLEDVIHTVFTELEQMGTAVYEYPNVRATGQGKLAADFYVTPDSMGGYVRDLKPWFSEIELIKVFAASKEFKSLTVRLGEESQVKDLMSVVPIPVSDSPRNVTAKINVLLQSYISRLALNGLSLQTDAVYIAQSATRLIRALFELCLELKMGNLARLAHRLYSMVDHKLWVGQSPFRQFPMLPERIALNAESTKLQWNQFFDLNDSDLVNILKPEGNSDLNLIKACLNSFPRFRIDAKAQPLSSKWMRLRAGIRALISQDDFESQQYESFYLLVEDQYSNILCHRRLNLQEIYQHENNDYTFYVKLPQVDWSAYLYLKIIGDRWITYNAESVISLRDLTVPAEETKIFVLEGNHQSEEPHEETLDQIRPSSWVPNSLLTRALKTWLSDSDRSGVFGLPPGEDQLNCARMVLDRAISQSHRVLVISPEVYEPLLTIYSPEHVTFLTFRQAERLSRGPNALAETFSGFDCMLILGIHSVGDPKYLEGEIVVTRLIRFWSRNKIGVRVIGLGLPMRGIASVGAWLKLKKSELANFELATRIPAFPEVITLNNSESFATALKNRTVSELLRSTEPLLMIVESSHAKRSLVRELQRLTGSYSEMTSASVDVYTMEQAQSLVFTAQQFTHAVLFISESVEPSVFVDLCGLATGTVVAFTYQPDFLTATLSEPLFLESSLHTQFSDALIDEIHSQTVHDPQTALALLASTLLYHRVRVNPSLYGCEDLQIWASRLVQQSFEQLSAAGLVDITDTDELTVEPTTLCSVLVHSGAYACDVFALQNGTATQLPPRNKAECTKTIDHRITLAVASDCSLSLLFRLIDLRQYHNQSLSVYSSSLLQIPYIDEEVAVRCQDAGIQTALDFIAIEDDQLRTTLLGFGNEDARMAEVANFVNTFPIMDITGAYLRTLNNNAMVYEVQIECDLDESELDAETSWFLVIGDPKTDKIHAFKQTQLTSSATTVSLECLTTEVPPSTKVWLLCGDRVDCDKECYIDH